ncbi:hypothetical protein KVT40_004548 [Elsinoe batatas]|uniref:RING-type domain-containing protein n=1 Tax=Elsinoe batatas TaxID=2601811 RepID=A0A8K0L1A8_9PEZI|nr:hypothetical protein KVT40_004548 [Elsinoe batatas]
MLARINFDVAESNIRIFHDVSATSAVVRLQAESFAQRFLATSEALPDHVTTTAVQHELSKAIQGTLHLSWHKATRNVWLNFGREHVASRVAQSFNTGHYLCWGQKIGGSRGGTNPVAWTVELQGVPASFQEQNVEAAIRRENDRPRHIELSAPNYETSAAEISVIVRNLVERYGPLASFLLQHTPGGKREKATARFEKDSDARAACALDGTKLKALGQGKLTATFFCSTKIKITAAIHKALRPQLETLVASWSDKGLNHSVYQTTGMRFVTLILRGTDTSVVAKATKQVEKLMKGLVLRDSEGLDLWHQSLSRNGAVFSKLLALCMELGAIVIRDKVKRQLRFYGSASDMPVVEADIMELLSQRSQSGKDDTPAEEDSQTPVGSSIAVGTCPICFCDADDPVNTSCGHTYCLECFGDNARAAASQPGDFTGVKCMGSDGACETTFTLDELKSHLSTSIFESMLQSIFDQHVRSHATELRFCPTPDCGYTYRCKTTSDCGNYICSNCCEPICRACHARHDDMTCADYQDMASGGHAALARLKKELNIKDCPSCTTPMEKTEGCNHMTCRGCGKHICWVCLAVFEASGPCYEHMRATHGGIGLDHLAG